LQIVPGKQIEPGRAIVIVAETALDLQMVAPAA
jgi:hypothetical protein